MNSKTLILTSTINISPIKSLKITNAEQRFCEYKKSLKKWLLNQNVFNKTIFVENSGFNLDNLAQYVDNLVHEKEIQFVSFISDDDSNNKDLGFGELESIDRAINSSKSNIDYFFKCTGRVYIKNIDFIGHSGLTSGTINFDNTSTTNAGLKIDNCTFTGNSLGIMSDYGASGDEGGAIEDTYIK